MVARQPDLLLEDTTEMATMTKVTLGADLLGAEEEATVSVASMQPRFLFLMRKSSMWGMTSLPRRYDEVVGGRDGVSCLVVDKVDVSVTLIPQCLMKVLGIQLVGLGWLMIGGRVVGGGDVGLVVRS